MQQLSNKNSHSLCEIENAEPPRNSLGTNSDIDPPGTKLFITANCPGQVAVVPRLSADPNDPLNWSHGRKYWHLFTVLFWCFVVNASSTWTGPAWGVWVAELSVTYTQLNYAAAVLLFMSALGVLISLPLALSYGRRLPCILASILLMIGLGLGQSMHDIGGFNAYCVLAGISLGPSFTTNNISILDVTHQHRQGTWVGVYSLVILLGTFLPPVVSGYIVSSLGWKWCFNILLLMMGIAFALLVFGSEETLFVRQELFPADIHNTSAHTRATYRQRMSLFQHNPDIRLGFWELMLFPFRLITLPAVAWASAMGAVGTFLLSFVITTQASFFAVAPYNFDASALGLMYFAIIIGMVIGAAWGGYFGDYLVARLAIRNNGITEPEHRLWAYLPVSWAAGSGIILYGVGASFGLHWAIPCIGLGLIGFALNSSLPLSMLYALDSYSDLSGETIQLINFTRSLAGGAMTFFIQPWISYSGTCNTSIAIGLVVFILSVSSIGFQVWGKRSRINFSNQYNGLIKKRHYV